MLVKGQTRTEYDQEWVWVPPDGLARGTWRATDGTRIGVLPPSEGCDSWMVIVPISDKKMVMQLGDETTAFHYAASARKARAN